MCQLILMTLAKRLRHVISSFIHEILVFFGISAIIDMKNKERQLSDAPTPESLRRYSSYLHNGLRPHRTLIIRFSVLIYKGR